MKPAGYRVTGETDDAAAERVDRTDECLVHKVEVPGQLLCAAAQTQRLGQPVGQRGEPGYVSEQSAACRALGKVHASGERPAPIQRQVSSLVLGLSNRWVRVPGRHFVDSTALERRWNGPVLKLRQTSVQVHLTEGGQGMPVESDPRLPSERKTAMRRLLAVLTLALFTLPAAAQEVEQAIDRLNELGLQHRNAPFDADAIADVQSLRIPREALAQFTDDDVRHLLVMPRLGSLTMDGPSGLTAAGLEQLSGIENLWSLSMRNANLKDEDVATVAALSGLKTLDLGLNRDLGDGALKVIAELPALETLTLDTTAVSDNGVARLAGHQQLRRLNLLQTAITDAAFTHLGQIPSLQNLNVSSTAVTGSGFGALANLSALEEIALRGTSLTDEAVETLSGITSLQRLFIWDSGITDAAVPHLAKLPNLKTLYLDDNEITDSGLQALAGHSNLSILWLSGTAVTDDGLVALTDIELENVMLNNTAVTDVGLLTLASIPSLRNISVRNAGATDAGIEAALAMPGRNERLQIRR